MGYLRRLILVNSAGYPLADVRLDGHCDIAGGQGVGKTTLMNAILYPFVVEDRFIDIDRLEKQRFSLYYFPSEMNSFVIYEVVNNQDVPYCIFIHRSGAILYYHFISAPFDYDWIYEGDEQVREWADVRAKLGRLGITIKTENRRESFNNIFLGKGSHYNEQYSIVKSNKDKDAIRPLLSAIFRNQPFNQDTLKNAMVAAVMSSNQMENEGIDLASHRRNLDGFSERFSDIQKMTVADRTGKTAIEPLAEALFDSVDMYYANQERLAKIPGRIVFAYNSAKSRIADLDGIISDNLAARDKIKQGWEAREKEIQERLDESIGHRGGINKELETVAEVEGKYKERNVKINELVEWIRDKAIHSKELDSLKKQRDALTSDSKDIQEQKETALKENRLFYQNLEVKEKATYTKRLESLQQKRDKTASDAEKAVAEIEKKYRELLGKNWRETEQKLINALVELEGRLSSAETVAEVKAALDAVATESRFDTVLSGVLAHRVGDLVDIPTLQAEVNAARERIERELDRKVQLEGDKIRELSAVATHKKKVLESIEAEKEAVENAHRAENKRIYDEHGAKVEEISAIYDTKIHGNNEEIKSALEELNALIKGEEDVLKAIDAFPSALEDKERYFDKKLSLTKEKERLNLSINSLREQKTSEKREYEEACSRLESKINGDTTERNSLESDIKNADLFLENRSAVKAACEDAIPIEDESRLPDITADYITISDNISDLKDRVSKGAQRLYEPGMLSRLDTFQLGIGINDSLSSFDDFLGVAEKLRTRLENSAEAMGMDKFIQLYSVTWLSEIKDIDTAMSPIENMLMQIGKLCRQSTTFIKQYNKTDCIDSFSMSIDEEDTPDIVKLMRTISMFFKNNNTSLGVDNLFAADDGSTNRQAVEYLKQFAEILNRDTDLKLISLSSMFNIRMDIEEKGNKIRNLLSFNNPGSRGTAIVLKAMLNMALLHIVLEKNQAPNTRLICAIDEMNTIEARNLDALTDFATAAGLFIIGSGQHHTKSALDYSYNVWDERGEDGVVNKYVSMDAQELEPVPDEV